MGQPSAPRIDIRIHSDEAFAGGRSFDETGPYRVLNGRVHLRIDADQIAADGFYDRNAIQRVGEGRLAASGDIFLLMPAGPGRGNGTLLHEFVNRGNKRALQFFNNGLPGNRPRAEADAGNGWLMQQGYTLAAIAWQGDVLRGDQRLTAELPGFIDDRPTRIAAEFIVENETTRFLPLSTKIGTRSYPAASMDTTAARLTRRRYQASEREEISSGAWAFERIDGDPSGLAAGDLMAMEQAIVPCRRHIHLLDGFRPGWIYELEYDACDALALDMGFLLVSETVAFLRHHEGPENPLAGAVRHTIGWGRSQSGRAIRDFIWRGFNTDHRGRRVFDGMLPHISGAGKTNMNRFSNLVVAASRQHEDHLHPSDLFPFSYARTRDHLSGAEDAILRRPATDPLVIHTQTSSEYWHRRGSLVHTDTRGNDLPQPDRVRIYLWSSSQHWSDTRPARPVRGACRDHQNNIVTDPFFPGTLTLMRDWIVDDREPPPSLVPSRSDGSLVTVAEYRAAFPAIPGVILPAEANRLRLVDYGPAFPDGGAPVLPLGVTGDEYAVLVPAPDALGNDLPGLHSPLVAAPLATATGWSMRTRGHGHGTLFSFMGTLIPLPETVEEAVLTGDPRPAIVALYPTTEIYSAAVRAAAEQLLSQRFVNEVGCRRFIELADGYAGSLNLHRL
ncbi:hypothetical protein GI374_14585 [Paracoccus sp. S-4012]|uniref:alpha/beta hydrolase domain-containing protein n=1 Tax=Paracoccus sp. S-4012 TaxID=2665648 RepID=UPI0012B076F1|nr:alpha/beta hydrolase domain-containing protein [Paracoccus sp. S-4012]MRX51639.1 hypothetical protein [Paracoccus sp. S-4012]